MDIFFKTKAIASILSITMILYLLAGVSSVKENNYKNNISSSHKLIDKTNTR